MHRLGCPSQGWLPGDVSIHRFRLPELEGSVIAVLGKIAALVRNRAETVMEENRPSQESGLFYCHFQKFHRGNATILGGYGKLLTSGTVQSNSLIAAQVSMNALVIWVSDRVVLS